MKPLLCNRPLNHHAHACGTMSTSGQRASSCRPASQPASHRPPPPENSHWPPAQGCFLLAFDASLSAGGICQSPSGAPAWWSGKKLGGLPLHCLPCLLPSPVWHPKNDHLRDQLSGISSLPPFPITPRKKHDLFLTCHGFLSCQYCTPSHSTVQPLLYFISCLCYEI